MFHCSLDMNSGVPLYIQLTEEIKALILSGALIPGQRLPVEREIMITLNLSRGTVRKAYERLVSEGYIRTEIGSGSYVLRKTAQERGGESKEDSAVAIDNLIEQMLDQQINSAEIRRLFEARMLMRRVPHRMNIAVIDCSIESVRLLRGLLAASIDANWMDFSLSTIKDYRNPESMFAPFDFIITAQMHYDIVTSLLPGLVDRILKAATTPDKSVIAEIKSLGNDISRSGVLTTSAAFKRLLHSQLQANGIRIAAENFELFRNIDLRKLERFLQTKTAIIIPPFHCLDISKAFTSCLLEYNHRGGNIIVYDDIIEEESLRELMQTISIRRSKTKDSHFLPTDTGADNHLAPTKGEPS